MKIISHKFVSNYIHEGISTNILINNQYSVKLYLNL